MTNTTLICRRSQLRYSSPPLPPPLLTLPRDVLRHNRLGETRNRQPRRCRSSHACYLGCCIYRGDRVPSARTRQRDANTDGVIFRPAVTNRVARLTPRPLSLAERLSCGRFRGKVGRYVRCCECDNATTNVMTDIWLLLLISTVVEVGIFDISSIECCVSNVN